jgi:RimJ/RimL family protein N-acetyltransferase
MAVDRPPIPERPLLRGERIWLRPIEERDLASYVAGVNDSEVGGMAGYPWPQSQSQATAWWQKVMEGWGRDGFYFTVCVLGEDRFIGTTWLKELNLVQGSAELAIFMDHEHIGGGWGADAQRTLLRFGFGQLGLERIYLTAFVGNRRAIRSYEKIGFLHEGVMRHAWRGLDGFQDGVLMSMLRDEWRAGEAG